MCLLAGGSALDIIEYIHPGEECFHQECMNKASEKTLCRKTECRTIFMTGDERVSGEDKINNFLQIKSCYLNHPILSKLVDTSAKPEETASEFAERIEKKFSEILVTLINPKIIFILGVGTDGHTAGIFPMDEVSFRKTYQDDKMYVPIHLEGLKIDSRASFTPGWILNNADELIGYVSGQSKLKVLTELNQTDANLNERPAELLKLHKRSTIYTDLDIS
jgi:6-phosphogluconolactonase/glucosamine-6-phosphate isomerase/deaminase